MQRLTTSTSKTKTSTSGKKFGWWRDLSITVKLAIGFVFISLFSVGATAYFAFDIAQESLTDAASRNVMDINSVMQGYVLEFLESEKGRAVDFASDGFIRDATNQIILGEDMSQELQRHLVDNKMSLDRTISGINIFDRDINIVASSDLVELTKGYDISDHLYVLDTLNNEYGEASVSDVIVQTHFDIGQELIVVSAPLTHRDTGELLGVLALYVELDELNAVLNGGRQTDLGGTWDDDSSEYSSEMYLVNSEGLMISESRYVAQVILSQEVDTPAATACDENYSAEFRYSNVFGIPVIGASSCLPRGWVLVVEVEEDAALEGLARLKRNVAISSFVVLIIALLLTILPARGILVPLRDLSSAVKKMDGHDFTARAHPSGSDEIGVLGGLFNNMAERLNVIDTMKTEFISLASHQLRKPLAVLKWSGELLSDEKVGKLSDEQHKYIARMNESTVEMVELVDGFLNISRIDSRLVKSNPERVELVTLVQKILHKYEDVIENKEFDVETLREEKIYVFADPLLVRELCTILISNAMKYTQQKGSIIIDVKSDSTGKLFSVTDTGVGIPAGEQDKIFSKFHRGSNVDRGRNDGIGLGLYAFKQLADVMDLNVGFNSTEGEGSRFWIHFD
ncbi:sensor histidine kinase [Candidatus Uhrbacteria bacterium]|jgi:signal transduction histidine kinase|nr:sensor histidine kinase [Candidatus Uhrbacteria bacterium]